MNYLERAKELFDDVVEVRRKIHEHPEVGFELPNTVDIIRKKLEEYNIDYKKLGNSDAIVGTLGDSTKGATLLLRSDMDALPICEKSNNPYKSKNDNAHLCGHDMHASTLLMVLKMLKENEKNLNGQIKFLFQPAEETLNGGNLMLKEGILENPKPDAGMALHMWPNGEELGVLIQRETALASALNFRITIKGVGAHGAMPNFGVDPVFVASQIINATNGILARELPSNRGASLSMGYVQAPGGAVNVIPDTVILEGTSRSLYAETAEHMAKRLPEIVEHISKAFRAEATFEILANVPTLENTPEMADLVKKSAEEALDGKYMIKNIGPMLASEDYSHIASQLPESVYFLISCPLKDEEGNVYALHHPYVQFNEEALVIGASTMAQAAENWLNENRK